MCGDCDLLLLQLDRSSFPEKLFVWKFLIGKILSFFMY